MDTGPGQAKQSTQTAESPSLQPVRANVYTYIYTFYVPEYVSMNVDRAARTTEKGQRHRPEWGRICTLERGLDMSVCAPHSLLAFSPIHFFTHPAGYESKKKEKAMSLQVSSSLLR